MVFTIILELFPAQIQRHYCTDTPSSSITFPTSNKLHIHSDKHCVLKISLAVQHFNTDSYCWVTSLLQRIYFSIGGLFKEDKLQGLCSLATSLSF